MGRPGRWARSRAMRSMRWSTWLLRSTKTASAGGTASPTTRSQRPPVRVIATWSWLANMRSSLTRATVRGVVTGFIIGVRGAGFWADLRRRTVTGGAAAVDINTVGIVGAGLMGSGIAEICARQGLRTVIAESDD